MYSRKQYLNGECSHREYYGQFVNNGIKEDVVSHFGIERIKNSQDEYFNDIPLGQWDSLVGFKFIGSTLVNKPTHIGLSLAEKLKETGEGVSCAGLVCIYKEAAKQIKEAK